MIYKFRKFTKILYIFLLYVTCQSLLHAELTSSKAAIEFSCLVWEPLPIQEVFYRDGSTYLPLEISPGKRSKLYPLTQTVNFELYQREVGENGVMLYKLIGRAPRIAGTKRMLFFIEPYPTPADLPLKILGVDDALNAFPPGTYRFVNSSNAELQIKFGGQTNRLPAKEIILVKSNVPKEGGFMPIMIANSNGESIFETRIYSQSTGRNMVFINPPTLPGERVKIKMLPQLIGNAPPTPPGKTSSAAP
jgi:hypothetical protein